MKTGRVLCLVLPALVASAAALAGPTRTLNSRHALASGEDLAFHLSVGSVTLETIESDQVEVEVRAECRRGRNCESLLDDIEIVPRQRGGRLRLEVERPDTRDSDELDIEVVVRVPRGTSVDLDLGVGSADISNLEGDLKVDIGVGDVDLDLPEGSLSAVKLDVGVGSARLRGGDSGQRENKKGFLGSTVHWRNGPGRAEVDIHVGVGDISMRLS